MLRRLWPGWKRALILVQPETVVRWHREGFRLYWAWISRRRAHAGRKCVSRELRELIFRVVAENPTWGAPRIHGELKMLGFEISERTVLNWMVFCVRGAIGFPLCRRCRSWRGHHSECSPCRKRAGKLCPHGKGWSYWRFVRPG